jgi:hypothetical protein
VLKLLKAEFFPFLLGKDTFIHVVDPQSHPNPIERALTHNEEHQSALELTYKSLA